MANFYPGFFALVLLFFFSSLQPAKASEPDFGGPTRLDSLADFGHCKTYIVVDTSCETRQLILSAFIYWTFTGVYQPAVVTWSNGIIAHKISVDPPGTWTWDAFGSSTCEPYHWFNTVTFDTPFYQDSIKILGPTVICPGDELPELNLNISSGDYTSIVWSPDNPTGGIDPYPVPQAGTYGVTLTDAFGCSSTDHVTITNVPLFVPVLTGPVRLCPEGDMGTVSVVNSGLYQAFQWETGETTPAFTITEPGLYQVTVTESHGCTGVGSLGVSSAEILPFTVSTTSPQVCPGQLDTLRVVGGFSSYAWSNGVIGISNIVNQAGTYTVTVTNIYGCTGTTSVTVAPLVPPVLQISSTPLCMGDTAVLSASGAGGAAYLWSSGQTTSVITTSIPGTYSVTVTGSGLCPTNTSTVLSFTQGPDPEIEPPGALNCLVSQATLDASASSTGPNLVLSWSTIDGHIISGDSSLTPLADAPGTYILLMVDTLTGCFSKDTVALLRDTTPPPAIAGLPDTLNCAFTYFEIGPDPAPANPDFLPIWSTLDGHILSDASSWSPQIDQAGDYTLTVINALNGCTNTASISIAQDTIAPTAQIEPPALLTCMQGMVPLDGSGSSSGSGFSALWTSANGLVAGEPDSLVSAASSVGDYTLMVTNLQNGCTATAVVPVLADVNIPTVGALSPDTLNCTIQQVQIDASASSTGPNFQYQWTTLNGNILSGGNTLQPLVGAPGIYTLQLLDAANNCSAVLAVNVLQNIIPPFAEAGPSQTLNCSDPSTILDGSGSSAGLNFSYNWTTTDGNIVSGNDALTPVVDGDGAYILQVTDHSNGCIATDTVLIINDSNAPVAQIDLPATLSCSTLQTTLNASGSTTSSDLTYTWTGNLLSGQGTLQPMIDQAGIYTLTISNTLNGCTDAATVTVLQDIVAPNIMVAPDAVINCFYPNGVIGNAGNPAAPNLEYQWSTSGGNIIPPANGPTALMDMAGTYQLVVTNTQNGCTATDQVVVSADFAVPLANAGSTSVLTCAMPSLSLQGSGSSGVNFSYLWTSLDGNIVSGANSISAVVDAAGTYNLWVSNTQNGCSAVSQVSITANADGPQAFAGLPQVLSCSLTQTALSAAGSSSGPEFSYAWSAGAGGNIVSGANTLTPQVDAPGVYTVTVTNATNLCTGTASVTISENIQAPVVDAGIDALLTCLVTQLNLEAEILSSASQNLVYQWTTGNGIILNGAATPNPAIGAPGIYLVQVTDTQNGCMGTDQLQITEDVAPPTTAIAAPEMLNCLVTQIALDASASSAGSNMVYEWTTTLGHFVSTQSAQHPLVDEPGDYSLLITNTSNGCTQSMDVTVPEDIQMPDAEAGINVGLDCDTPTNQLDGTGSSQGPGFSYSWTTVNGHILSGADALTPVIDAPGAYVLSVLNTQNGCFQTAEVEITADFQQPELLIAPPQILNCTLSATTLFATGTSLGNPAEINWSSPNGNIVAGAQSLTPIIDAPGLYTLQVVNPANGCAATQNVVVSEDIQIPSLQVKPASLLTCSVLQTALEGVAPAQSEVHWSTLDGHILSGAGTLYPMVDAPGIYEITIFSSQNGCSNTAQVPVTQELNVPTGIQFKLQPPLCNGTPGTLTVEQVMGGVGPFAYSIDGGQHFFTSADFDDLTPGSYDLIIQDANGCERTELVTVPQPPLPLVTTPLNVELELGGNQQIIATVPPIFPLALVDTVIWTPVTGLTFEGNSNLQLLNPVAQPYTSTQYTVTIITKEGCKASARTLVRVNRDADIYVPNVIWPEDPDGNNSIFLVFARDESIARIKKLEIFDRWGSLVFSNKDFRPNDPASGWDGLCKGLPVNPGVFVWWTEVELVDGRVILLKGDVTVMR